MKNEKEITKWMCYDISWACLGVQRKKTDRQTIENDELNEQKLQDFLKVNKDKIRKVQRVHHGAEIKEKVKQRMHDEL